MLWSRKDALRVPIGALFRGQDGGWHAFKLDGSRARDTALEIGHINDEYGEVLSGLDAGDVVIVNPSGSIIDGARVSPR